VHPLSICTWEEAEVLQLKMSQQRARGKLDKRLPAESYLASATISICPGVRSNLVQTVPSLQHVPILAERYAAVGVVWSILQFSPLTQMSADEVSEAVLRVIVVAIEAVKFGMMALGLVALFPA